MQTVHGLGLLSIDVRRLHAVYSDIFARMVLVSSVQNKFVHTQEVSLFAANSQPAYLDVCRSCSVCCHPAPLVCA